MQYEIEPHTWVLCEPQRCVCNCRENVQQFARSVVAPHAEHVDRTNNFPTDVDLWREMGEFGLLGVLPLDCSTSIHIAAT